MFVSQAMSQDKLNLSHYVDLLDLTYEVIQVLKGTTPTVRWLADCQEMAIKLFLHAATVYSLRQNGTRCPVPKSQKEGSSFFDLASVQVIVRSALDTYLRMFEVFFEPTAYDERDFQHACWRLSGYASREGVLPDPTLIDQAFQTQQEIENLRNRIKATAKFATLKEDQQRQILRGKRLNRRRSDWAKAAGLSEDLVELVYSYQSSYVHADGLSGEQIMDAQTKEKQIQFMNSSMYTVLIILAKTILLYANTFDKSRAVCEQRSETFLLAKIYSCVAKKFKVSRIHFFESTS